MLLYNELNQLVDLSVLKAELKEELKNESDNIIPTEEEIENDLGSYYSQAMILESENYGFKTLALESFDSNSFSIRGLGRNILKKIKRFICSILNNESGEYDIIEAVLNAIANLIPGGIIIKFVVKKILKFILSMGVGKFCAA